MRTMTNHLYVVPWGDSFTLAVAVTDSETHTIYFRAWEGTRWIDIDHDATKDELRLKRVEADGLLTLLDSLNADWRCDVEGNGGEEVDVPPFAEHLGEVFRVALAMARLSSGSTSSYRANVQLERDVISSFTEKHKRAP